MPLGQTVTENTETVAAPIRPAKKVVAKKVAAKAAAKKPVKAKAKAAVKSAKKRAKKPGKRLDDAKAAKVRVLYATKNKDGSRKYTQSAIAAQMGVTQPAIWHVIHNRTHKIKTSRKK